MDLDQGERGGMLGMVVHDVVLDLVGQPEAELAVGGSGGHGDHRPWPNGTPAGRRRQGRKVLTRATARAPSRPRCRSCGECRRPTPARGGSLRHVRPRQQDQTIDSQLLVEVGCLGVEATGGRDRQLQPAESGRALEAVEVGSDGVDHLPRSRPHGSR